MIWEMKSVKGREREDDKEESGMIRTKWRFLKDLRYREWKKVNNWDEDDLDRVIDSKEALPEMIQDYETQMVVVGTDVISLYPNMVVGRVVKNIKEAVRIFKIEFRDIDYLNWDAETCRVIPIRRGKRGTRPYLNGPGPRGKIRGDQEQWIFPDIELEDWEKRKILAEVHSGTTNR